MTDPQEEANDLQIINAYCRLMDMERVHLARYLAPEAQLEWFGRTVVGRDKIKTYLGLDVPETRHNVLGNVMPGSPVPPRRCRPPAPPPPPLREVRVSDLSESLDQLRVHEGVPTTPPSGLGPAPKALLGPLSAATAAAQPRFCKAEMGLEFSRRRDSMTGGWEEMRWARNCVLKLGFVRPHLDGFNSDVQFTAIVYRNGSRCRRNLGQLFDQMDE